MQTDSSFPVKRAFLYSLIASVAITAVLAIIAILRGRSEWFEARVMLTSLTISGCSICGLACGALLERRRDRVVPLAGILFAVLAAGLLIFGIWFDPRVDDFWRITATITTLAIACAHLSLLLMARLAPRFNWSRVVNHILVLGLAGLIIAMIFMDSPGQNLFRMLAIGAVSVASFSVLTPIFHFLSRQQIADTDGEKEADSQSIDHEIERLRARIAQLEELKAKLG